MPLRSMAMSFSNSFMLKTERNGRKRMDKCYYAAARLNQKETTKVHKPIELQAEHIYITQVLFKAFHLSWINPYIYFKRFLQP